MGQPLFNSNIFILNHNGRVSVKTGTVYNRNHNDRNFDVSHAENINADMIKQNLIIHYDAHNHPTLVNSNNSKRKSIDEHENEIYQELFSESLGKQNSRNIAIRHPERNKTIDDKLNDKNTCPEETVFQIGSLEDGFPEPNILMEIFEEFQEELIHRYGNNLHFLDATLHLDEAVPHIHIRKVWTYDGKDGLDISQNKALIEMNFERPHPDKPRNKYNNERLEAFFSKFLKPIFKRFKGSRQDEVLSVLDQMPIDHTSAQKLVKMGYPNLEGHTYEESLDIAEQRDIYQMLQEHDSSINLDDISAVEYDNLIDSIKDGMSVQDATKQLAEALAERYVPPVRRRGGR